ncbi:MAG TPA: response regulator [Candidatus Acidoferrum sp.]|nr:response regulator [Candidatus Acidoferrum sp.]
MGESDLNSRRPTVISVGSSRGHDLNPGDKTKIAAATTRMLPVQAPVNILIVDDEPKNLTVLEAILDAPGYRLVRAESAEQALLALLADEFALLILDIRMPGVTGLELAQMIKARKKTASVPIIFLTAYYDDDQHVLEGYETGAVDYAKKPVNPAILRSKVGIFAELYRKQRNLEEVNRALVAEVCSRRHAEEQLRELNNTLEQRVAERTASLQLSEARLRDSERQLQELIAAIPAAIYTTDAQGKITYFNEAATELVGHTPTTGSDEWCVTWKLYHPNGTPLPYDQCPMAIALKEGRAIRNAEVVAERPDGTRVPFIPYPTPLRDGAGKIVGAINMLVDVSERKQAETQQRILLNELNHRVKNNMQMLQILLEAGARRAESSEAREVLDEASSRVMAMAAAQRVLYTTHDATRFNARDFLNAVCESAKQTFPQELAIDYEADAIQLSNDAAMPLALIANELLTNAVKYGLNGQGAGTIRVRLRRADESFLFYVEDDGPGFDLQSVQRRSSGLALVQGLARQLGGKFEVTRTPATRCSLRFQ